MEIRKSLTILLVSSLINSVGLAQSRIDYPIIGEACPFFSFDGMTHFSKSKVSLHDFKGKWLILDLWSHHCLSCVKSFPKLNDLQNTFREDVQFVMVAADAKSDSTLFERLSITYHLSIPSVYSSSLFAQFGVETVPHIIILNPQGTVWAITDSQFLTHENIQKMVQGGHPHFEHKPNAYEKKKLTNKIDSIKPLTLFESSLSQWTKGSRINIVTAIDRNPDSGKYETLATSLSRLYMIAYLGRSDWRADDSLYGKFWPVPVFEMADSTFYSRRGTSQLYNYSLTIPTLKATRSYLQWAMQCDLKKFFGYEVSIETRSMPCWKLLQLSQDLNIASHGDNQVISSDYTGIRLINCPIQKLLATIANYNPTEPPFINTSMIMNNVDITLSAVITDIQVVRKALHQYRLDLVRSYNPIKVLVVRDSNIEKFK